MVLEQKYLLRWRFDFLNDKPSKFGMWSRPAAKNRPQEMASMVNKEHLIRAVIEGKDIETREVKVLAECDGWDFRNFQWVNIAVQAMSGSRPVGPARHELAGLKLLTRTLALEVYKDGTQRVNPLAPEDQDFQFEWMRS